MIKKLTNAKLSTLTGYSKTVFSFWTSKSAVKEATEETKFRFNALQLGATLLDNGYDFELIKKLLTERAELEKELFDIIEKNEAVKIELNKIVEKVRA